MEVIFKKGTPRVEIDNELFMKLRKMHISSGGRRIAVFGEVKKSGNSYKIVGLYVPQQKTSNIYTIIPQGELAQLGNKYMCVIRLCNKNDTTLETNNKTFFENTTTDMENYISIAFYGEDCMIDIAYESIIFHDVKLSIIFNYKEEERKAIKEELSVVSEWDYKSGYDPTIREEYIPPKILSEKISWRDVV